MAPTPPWVPFLVLSPAYFSHPAPGSVSRPCSTTPTTATWRMPFPTTSCDLSPVTGMTPGAGSSSGATRGWPGSGCLVLGGRVSDGWWLASRSVARSGVAGRDRARLHFSSTPSPTSSLPSRPTPEPQDTHTSKHFPISDSSQHHQDPPSLLEKAWDSPVDPTSVLHLQQQ